MLVFVILALIAATIIIAYKFAKSKPKKEEIFAPTVVEPVVEVKKEAPKAKAPKAVTKKAAKSVEK